MKLRSRKSYNCDHSSNNNKNAEQNDQKPSTPPPPHKDSKIPLVNNNKNLYKTKYFLRKNSSKIYSIFNQEKTQFLVEAYKKFGKVDKLFEQKSFFAMPSFLSKSLFLRCQAF